MKKDKTVLIAIPTYSGLIPYKTAQSLLQLIKPIQASILFIPRQRIDKARNFAVINALNGNVDYLLFVDDDNPIPPDTLIKFLDDDKDIITAPILQRGGEHKLCLFNKRIINEEKGKGLVVYDHIDKLNTTSSDLIQVDACGMGCTLIKRNVLETLNKKYEDHIFEFGDIEVNGQRRTMSEDVEFCERATKEGFEIWADSRIRPIHLGDQREVVYY